MCLAVQLGEVWLCVGGYEYLCGSWPNIWEGLHAENLGFCLGKEGYAGVVLCGI